MVDEPWWRRRHELRASPDAEWVERCSAWLQRPQGDLGPAAWLVLLQPEHHDHDLRLPDGTLHAATLLEWSAPARGVPFDVVIEPAWAAPHDGATELAVDVRAHVDGREVASGRGIYRVPGELEPFGERALPERPSQAGTVAQRVRLTLDEGQVGAYEAVAGTAHPMHDDAGYAHRHGFPGVVVPGPLLALTVMHQARPGASGGARFWYRRPVSAGTLLRIERTEREGDRTCWWVTKPAGEVAVVAELAGGAAP